MPCKQNLNTLQQLWTSLPDSRQLDLHQQRWLFYNEDNNSLHPMSLHCIFCYHCYDQGKQKSHAVYFKFLQMFMKKKKHLWCSVWEVWVSMFSKGQAGLEEALDCFSHQSLRWFPVSLAEWSGPQRVKALWSNQGLWHFCGFTFWFWEQSISIKTVFLQLYYVLLLACILKRGCSEQNWSICDTHLWQWAVKVLQSNFISIESSSWRITLPLQLLQ